MDLCYLQIVGTHITWKEKFPSGTHYTVIISSKDFNIQSLIGGWPRLVKDGENVVRSDSTLEGIIPRFQKSGIQEPELVFTRQLRFSL